MALPFAFYPASFDVLPLSRASGGARDGLHATGDDGAPRPAYNVEKYPDGSYALAVAVPGFREPELSVTFVKGSVRVDGKPSAAPGEGTEYVYAEIPPRPFELQFRLADGMKIIGADLKDGMLRVRFTRETPEAEKPLKIPVRVLGD